MFTVDGHYTFGRNSRERPFRRYQPWPRSNAMLEIALRCDSRIAFRLNVITHYNIIRDYMSQGEYHGEMKIQAPR